VRIEDHGLIGEAAALVGRHGSVDGLCLPRFDRAFGHLTPIGAAVPTAKTGSKCVA
jgi:hypothetical protein